MSVSNKDVEVLSEALFCYYFAIYKKGKQKEYKIELWDDIQNSSDLSKFTANLGITSMVKNVNNDPAFRSRIKKVSEFLANRKFFWANALESQMNAFFSNSKINLSGMILIVLMNNYQQK